MFSLASNQHKSHQIHLFNQTIIHWIELYLKVQEILINSAKPFNEWIITSHLSRQSRISIKYIKYHNFNIFSIKFSLVVIPKQIKNRLLASKLNIVQTTNRKKAKTDNRKWETIKTTTTMKIIKPNTHTKKIY